MTWQSWILNISRTTTTNDITLTLPWWSPSPDWTCRHTAPAPGCQGRPPPAPPGGWWCWTRTPSSEALWEGSTRRTASDLTTQQHLDNSDCIMHHSSEVNAVPSVFSLIPRPLVKSKDCLWQCSLLTAQSQEFMRQCSHLPNIVCSEHYNLNSVISSCRCWNSI